MNRQPDSTQRITSPMLDKLRQRVTARYAGLEKSEVTLKTALPWLSFIRYSEPTEMRKGILEPAMCMILQGEKRVLIGQEVIDYGAGSYVLAAIDMLISGQVTQATGEEPYLGVRIELNIPEMADMLIDMKVAPPVPKVTGQGSKVAAYVAASDELLQDAFLRLITMLDKPQELQALGGLIKKEIFYRLITNPQCDTFYHHLLSYYQGKGVSDAVIWIKQNFTKPLRMDDLARQVGMSASSLHHRFKALTAMSPLQYQKQIRLLEARRLLLAGDLDAATAAFQVGYESPSQFNREYRRSFGAPPLQDVEQLRLAGYGTVTHY